MEPKINRNLLHVGLNEFKCATKVFKRKRLKMGPVLMAYENGFLSFESGEVTVVMHAQGEWHGRAVFSAPVLRALATIPPSVDPIPMAYAENHILIASMTIPCKWTMPGQELVQEIENPGLLDLLALGRTLTRAEVKGSALGKRISSAIEKAERSIKNAAVQLVELDITEGEIRALVEARIALRLSKGD